MFIGHFAVGFAAKRFAPRASLAPLLAAPLLCDILWPVFLRLGWEHVRIVPYITRFNDLDLYDFPWSHSLAMSIVWATAFAGIYHGVTRYSPGTVTIWIGVISHWVLDWITHRPDMPLYPGGGPKLGLGLWNSVAGTMIVEVSMLIVGVWLYMQATKTRDRIGKYAFAAYVLLLLVLYFGDAFSARATEPAAAPVSEIFWSGIIAETIFLFWAWWFDHHREPRSAMAA